MRIALLEPFLGGSHRQWAEDYARYSSHEIKIFGLSGHHWKWRMHGGAVSISRLFSESSFKPDLLLASDMLDLNAFLSLTRATTHHIPAALYFHENQLSYPWSPTDADVSLQRDNHYSFINYTSALSANKIFFNSSYHQESFLKALPEFLKMFPDHQELNSVEEIKNKSGVLYPGINLQKIKSLQPEKIEHHERAVILWNHRWEYDKNPETFFNTLFELKERGVEFKLVVLGEKFNRYPKNFDTAREKLVEEILQFGFVESQKEYVQWLSVCDILPVTSIQDFFGISVIEAMSCNVIPLLPKRLAYPEHLPESLHNTFFYEENNREFTNRLQRMIFDVKILRKQQVAQFTERYDWKKLVSKYDSELEKVVNVGK